MNPGIISGILLVGAAYSLFVLAASRMLAAEKARSRSPFSEKLLRPAGESLRMKVDEIQDEITEICLILGILIISPGVCLMVINSDSILGLGVWAVFATVLSGFALSYWKKLRGLRETLRNHRLGLDGERYVASELNALIARGYRVFHDFVVDWRTGGEESNFNIDHIAVGPEGVFAIETKTIRKPLDPVTGKKMAYKLEYDGESLIMPHRTDVRMLNQTQYSALVLCEWLTGSARESVEVIPALVIPGWFIEYRGKGLVRVFSGKGVGRQLPNTGRAGALSAEEIQRIGDRIEAHCRNVEG